MNYQASQVPPWKEIFSTIGSQLKLRGGLIVQRTAVIFTPAAIAVILVWPLFSLGYFFIASLLLWLIALGTIMVNSIFRLEQMIWLDSYFDGKNLSQKESWKIAKKLFWANLYLQFKLFYRYYLWFWILFLGLIYLFIYGIIAKGFLTSFSESVQIAMYSAIIIFSGIGFVVLFRYLKVTLSYIPFLFLDRYTKDNVHSSAFWTEFYKELNELNRISKGEAFMKNVLLELGADAGMTLVEFIVGVMRLGLAGRLIAEVGHRVMLYAKYSGRYVLYRFAFKELHGKDRHINEYIYSLK